VWADAVNVAASTPGYLEKTGSDGWDAGATDDLVPETRTARRELQMQ
jgi:hypothetical protein